MDEHNALTVTAGTTDVAPANWSLLENRDVEIQLDGRVIDRGIVDAAAADGSILWLKPDGATQRRLIELTTDVNLRICNAG